jgi:hypothetical protein
MKEQAAPDRRPRWTLLVAVATVAHLVAYLVAAPEHVVDASWPAHARFHVLQALSWIVGGDLVILLVVWPRSRMPARLRLAVVVLGALCFHASYFGALAMIWQGRPERASATPIMAAIALVYFLGLLGAFWARREGAAGGGR